MTIRLHTLLPKNRRGTRTRAFLLGMCGMVAFILWSSCGGKNAFVPRPRAYPRIVLPVATYKVCCEDKHLHYAFEMSNYATVEQDSTPFFADAKRNPNWINIRYPDYNATIYVSYIPIQGYSTYKRKMNNGTYVDSVAKNSFDQLLKNSYTLVYKHSTKASEIKDSAFTNPQGIRGMFFNISGNTATKYQFFATDTTTHYLRAVLYFDSTPNEDSLRPLNAYFVNDLKQMMNTLRWK